MPFHKAEEIFHALLLLVGEDPKREGLKDTPLRAFKAWQEWTSGYREDAKDHFKDFADGAQKYDEMIWVKDLPFYSQCEHHLAPFFGTFTVAYMPDKRVLGLSKFERVFEVFARRLQVQERLTVQFADCVWENLKPLGVGVIVKARHMCMESRGISKQGHHTVTSALRGCFKGSKSIRAEFLSIAK